MKDIVFEAPFGEERKTVKLSQPTGAGGDSFTVMVDNYCFGRVYKRNGEWAGDGQGLYTEDYAILGERIEGALNNSAA